MWRVGVNTLGVLNLWHNSIGVCSCNNISIVFMEKCLEIFVASYIYLFLVALDGSLPCAMT